MTLTHRIFAGTCIAALVVCTGVGCNKRERVDRDGFTERSYDQGATDKSGVGTTTVTGADLGALTSDTAIDRITVARCQRETACNNIGSDKHFVSYDVCARELRAKVGDDLAASKCPRGVDAAAIDKCTESIRNEGCNDPGDTLSRLAACRTSALCLSQ